MQTREALLTVWPALHVARDELTDEQWDDVCHAMANLAERAGLDPMEIAEAVPDEPLTLREARCDECGCTGAPDDIGTVCRVCCRGIIRGVLRS